MFQHSGKRQFYFDYMMLRGRLKLGKIVHPWSLVTNIVISLGWGWWKWYQRACNETSLHCDFPLHNKGDWRIFIPGLHMLSIYRLARSILLMEVSDAYRRTSPLIAALLAVFPLASAIYLQQALNHHWVSHVVHENVTSLHKRKQTQHRESPLYQFGQ